MTLLSIIYVSATIVIVVSVIAGAAIYMIDKNAGRIEKRADQ
jgi:hypothetical protein